VGAIAAVMAATMTLGLVGGSAIAAEGAKPDAVLKMVPDNVAFFSDSLRNREQIETIAHSRAWAKLTNMPVVQMGLAMYQMQASNPDSPAGKIAAVLKDAETQKTLSVVGDMFSQEAFCYGEQNVGDFMDLAQRIVGAMRYGPAILQLSGKAHDIPPENLQATVLLAAFAQNTKLMKVPDVVFGFKVSDVKAAQAQLDRLEKAAGEALVQVPQLNGRLKKTTIDGHQYLTLSLDGAMLPWDQANMEELKALEAQPGDVDKVVAQVKKMTLVVAMGMRDGYLLVSIGSSSDALARLGRGAHLADRPEMAPLAKFADKRLTAVGYVSKEMCQRLLSNKKDIDDLLKAGGEMLSLVDLPKQDRDDIRKDAAALAADLKSLSPDIGPMMGLSFLTDSGIENYQYSWGTHGGLDGSKPLSLLQHVGGSPMIAVVNRAKVSVQDYNLLVKWLGVGYRYFDKYGKPRIPEKERAKVQQFMASAMPLLVRLDQTTRDMLLPALADGQIGFILDAKLKSKQFIESLPATEKAMPMFEPALVLGVSDSKLLLKACAEYKAIANEFIDVVRKIEGSNVPDDFRIPDAKVYERKAGTLYEYPLPKQWGVDKKIGPNAGLSSSVAVLSINAKHTLRLLTATPLTLQGRTIDIGQPQAGSGVVDFAGLIDTVTPWVDWSIDLCRVWPAEDQSNQGNEGKAATVDTDPKAATVYAVPKSAFVSHVHTVLDVLKTLRTITVETRIDGKAMVQHTVVEFRDIEK
jgi:hypothetical protein